jgi:hypothetical protein
MFEFSRGFGCSCCRKRLYGAYAGAVHLLLLLLQQHRLLFET